jgi:hypothetical protein
VSDWDFLHDMHDRGYSPEDIADAAATGVAPWQWERVDIAWAEEQLEHQPKEDAKSIAPAGRRDGFPFSISTQTAIFQDLVNCAVRHFENTGRYLQVWGELGEIYAEIRFGLRRHATHAPGSDGTIDGKLVEVKTISPEKGSGRAWVKSQGDFEQLLIVRIDQDFQFRSKLFERSELKGGAGKYLNGRLD